ncbi:MAG TPA: AAA family ATPase [Candidatus Limnocylindrales bacterium]|nr:AAA family ATPase [Candidatus Limnocylindrales bacterium]
MSGETGRRERKSITVVFADLVGFTARADALDPEDVEAFLRPYHERLRAEFQRFGGTVEKFIGDAVVAIFGAPVAHEDDPERAVRAAIAIRDAIREAGELEVRIAVNTGEAIVRLDARADAGEGIATGDVLNTASRLQAVAPVNGILVGEPTYRATRDVISYAPAAAVEAKGKPVPLAVWEAVEARSRLGVDVRQGSATPLVGRERERSILLDTLARVEAERTPQLVTLVGVPGIGKSRLVSELLGSLEQSDEMRYWRQGRSLPYGEGVSFWALGEMVKAQAGILDGDAPDDVAAKLELAVRELVEPDEAAWVTTSLRPLVGLGGSGEGDGPMRREESFAAWRRLFEAMAERRPLVLVFEDLHWADDGLLDFVDHLVDWATGVPILVACTARPELLERRPGWAGGKPNALTLGVAPLSEVESARLLSLLLGTPVLAAETQAALLERASGNPLYAEQFARLLQERGSLDELSLPETVQGLIAARLDTLAADEKALLQEAAVVGKVFWAGALPARVDVDQAALLHGLERKEFVRRERRSSVAGDAEYSFRHVLVRDVAYAQIPRGDRIAKHLRTAAWIDAVTTSGDSGELVAHHLAAALELSPAGLPADVADRAQVAFADAGEHALALGAFALAVRWFRAALDLVPEGDGRRGRLLFGLGRAEYGATGAGDAMLEEAIALLEASGDPTTAAEAEALLTLSAWQRGDREAWVRHLDHAIELVADLPPSRAKASVLATRARRMVIAGDNAAGLPVAREARAMAESLGLVDLQAHALNSLGMALHATGEGDGYDELRRSIELYDSINSVDASIGWNNLASFLEADGRLSEAGEAARTATRYGRRFGYEPLLRWDRYNTVDWDYLEGRWDDAVRRADALIDETEAGAAHYMAPLTLQVRGRIRSARGDLAGAIRDSEAALEITRTIGDVQSVVPGLAHWVAVLVDAGRMAEADAAATELLGRQRAGGLTFRAPAFLIDALERLGRLDEMLANYGNRRRTRWLEAAERVAAGDWPGAAEVYSVIGSPTDEALARLRAAAQLVGEGRRADADAQAARAIEFWRSVGASRHVAEGEALLAATA